MARLVVVLCLLAACDGIRNVAGQPATSPPELTALAASALLITDVETPPHRIDVPPVLFRKGLPPHSGDYKICVDAQGAVADVTVIRAASARNGRVFTGSESLDGYWIDIVKGWRYRPHQVVGGASAFCYLATLEAPRLVVTAEQEGGPGNTPPPVRLSDITLPQYRLTLPPELTRSSFVVWGLYELCIGSNGQVTSVKVIKDAAEEFGVDQAWTKIMQSWVYRPSTDGGQPACHVERLEARML